MFEKLSRHERSINTQTFSKTQKVKKSLKELTAKEKDLTEKKDKCGESTKQLRTRLRVYKVRDTLIRMGEDADDTREEVIEAEECQFRSELAKDKEGLVSVLGSLGQLVIPSFQQTK